MLDFELSQLHKPYVVIMDGITSESFIKCLQYEPTLMETDQFNFSYLLPSSSGRLTVRSGWWRWTLHTSPV